MRIRPDNVGHRTVKKVSSDTLSVGDRKFTFDSVIDSNANQVCSLIDIREFIFLYLNSKLSNALLLLKKINLNPSLFVILYPVKLKTFT